MKDYKKHIDRIKDNIIDDIIKITQKKGKYYGHHFISIKNNSIFDSVRYGWDLELSSRRCDDYKHLMIWFKSDSNKYYIIDSKEGEIHSSHFDARLIDVDTLYYILETINKYKPL